MNLKKLVLFLFISLSTQTISAKNGYHGPWKWNEALPGMIQIDTNFYVDQFETTNYNWLEYMYWVKRIFGDASPEYLATIPTTKLWLDEEKCLSEFAEYYFVNPHYQNYPLVGVTQQQAEKFCKWRSDRVFEYMLICEKQIKFQPDQDASNYFSIENYFSGKYTNSPPNWRYNFFPEFELPTLEQWQKIMHYTVDQNEKIRQKKKKATTNSWIQIQPCLADTVANNPTVPVDRWYRKTQIAHLSGNVSEWLKEVNQFIGTSWKDSKNQAPNESRVHIGPSTSIGFRSSCKWKEYKRN